jgi:hypothetical protein
VAQNSVYYSLVIWKRRYILHSFYSTQGGTLLNGCQEVLTSILLRSTSTFRETRFVLDRYIQPLGHTIGNASNYI